VAPSYAVDVLTVRKRIRTAEGGRLDEVLRSAGIPLNLYCGGRGLCGKCVVEIVRGKVSPPGGPEAALLAGKGFSPRHRLACMLRVRGPLSVRIPRGSVPGKIRVLDAGFAEKFEPAPAVKKYVIAPEAPSLDAPLSLAESLEKKLGRRLALSPEAVGELPGALVRGGGKVTVTVLDGREILDVESGDETDGCFGVAVDIGTSTVVVELIDLNTGRTRGRTASINAQVRFGPDVVTRISHAYEKPEGLSELSAVIRSQIDEMIRELAGKAGVPTGQIYEIVTAGNTAMTHFLFGVPVNTLAVAPFHGVFAVSPEARAGSLGLNVHPRARVYAAPNVRGFVGGDIAAGLSAVGMSGRTGRVLFVDLGTNGEIVLKAGGATSTTSTAAGPAFEGLSISCGMPALPGAVAEARWSGGFKVRTVGNKDVRGICGTGLIDILAVALAKGLLSSSGRIRTETGDIPVAGEVVLTQADIRGLQLAVAAVKSGVRMMIEQSGLRISDLDEILVAGGFGASLNIRNAMAVGLLPGVPERKVVFVGNTSLAGARKLLLSFPARDAIETYAKKIRHVSLASGRDFQDHFVSALEFGPYSGDV
jgi:uncharacterized 2Fe-2S/4Fe-4S cluster protein (DUF4445 family)